MNDNSKYNKIKVQILKHPKLADAYVKLKPTKDDCTVVSNLASIAEHTTESTGNLTEEILSKLCYSMSALCAVVERFLIEHGQAYCHINRINRFVQVWKPILVAPARARFEEALALSPDTPGFLPDISKEPLKKILPSKININSRKQDYISLATGLSPSGSFDIPLFDWQYHLNEARVAVAAAYTLIYSIDDGSDLMRMIEESKKRMAEYNTMLETIDTWEPEGDDLAGVAVKSRSKHLSQLRNKRIASFEEAIAELGKSSLSLTIGDIGAKFEKAVEAISSLRDATKNLERELDAAERRGPLLERMQEDRNRIVMTIAEADSVEDKMAGHAHQSICAASGIIAKVVAEFLPDVESFVKVGDQKGVKRSVLSYAGNNLLPYLASKLTNFHKMACRFESQLSAHPKAKLWTGQIKSLGVAWASVKESDTKCRVYLQHAHVLSTVLVTLVQAQDKGVKAALVQAVKKRIPAEVLETMVPWSPAMMEALA